MLSFHLLLICLFLWSVLDDHAVMSSLHFLYVAYKLQCPYDVHCAGYSFPELAAARATEHGVAASPS